MRPVTLVMGPATAENAEACNQLAALPLAVAEPDIRRLIAALRARQTRFTKNAALCARARNHRGEALMRTERDASQRLLELLSAAITATTERASECERFVYELRPVAGTREGPRGNASPRPEMERTHLPTGSS